MHLADFRAAHIMKERLSKRLLKQPGIHAVGVGFHHPRKPGRGAAVIVYRGSFSASGKSKRRPARKPPSKKTLKLNGKTVAVPIRYVDTPKFRAHADAGAPFQRRIRPVIAGYSIGTANESGTAGLIVAGQKGSRYVLSNNHVLSSNNRRIPVPTIQPGGADGGTVRNDQIGNLSRLVKLKKKGTNYLDAALSKPLRKSLLAPRYARFGTVPGYVTSYKVGDRFKKVGRTTGVTFGTVESVNTDVVVSYGDFGGLGDIKFKNQSIVRGANAVSLPGDSGSVWLRNKDNFAAAVNFAGSDNGTLSISFPIDRAMSVFGVKVAQPGRTALSRKKVKRSGYNYIKRLTAKQRSGIRVVRAARGK